MGFSLVNGGSPQAFPGQMVFDTVATYEAGTFTDFGATPVQDSYFDYAIMEWSGGAANPILRGMLPAPIGTKRVIQKSVGGAAGAVTMTHNDGAAPVGNRFFNANTLANYQIQQNGGVAYIYGPVRNIGNCWMTRIRP